MYTHIYISLNILLKTEQVEGFSNSLGLLTTGESIVLKNEQTNDNIDSSSEGSGFKRISLIFFLSFPLSLPSFFLCW